MFETPSLKQKLAQKILVAREDVKEVLSAHADDKISDVTVGQAYGGMRGVKCMVTETSALDADEGIRFRGYSIPELQEKLPRAPGSQQPLPEGLFFLLLTGELPNAAEVAEITAAWRGAETLPAATIAQLEALPRDTHPMTQFSAGILSLQRESIFAARYSEGMAKTEYWEAMFDDSMLLLARLPLVAAYIYRRSYKQQQIAPAEQSLDWGANLAHMMGVENERFRELMRLYLTIHADHEGGNVSAHTTHLVGSALADPYLALSAGMNGLAGPLHGLANQEVVRWITGMIEEISDDPTAEQVKEYAWKTLNSGQVVPGYGHAVLRRTDPRYMAQRQFALEHLADDKLFKVVSLLYDVVPDVLKEHGKAKNPWPNVDAHSGCLLMHYGIVEYDFFTVLFGVSRAVGVLASLVWDRALGLSLERPKSVTSAWIREQVTSTVG